MKHESRKAPRSVRIGAALVGLGSIIGMPVAKAALKANSAPLSIEVSARPNTAPSLGKVALNVEADRTGLDLTTAVNHDVSDMVARLNTVSSKYQTAAGNVLDEQGHTVATYNYLTRMVPIPGSSHNVWVQAQINRDPITKSVTSVNISETITDATDPNGPSILPVDGTNTSFVNYERPDGDNLHWIMNGSEVDPNGEGSTAYVTARGVNTSRYEGSQAITAQQTEDFRAQAMAGLDVLANGVYTPLDERATNGAR